MTTELYKALVEAQKAARAVAKDSKNQFHRYDYASSESVIAEAREALNGAGLAFMPLGWRFEASPLESSAEDKARLAGRIHVTYMLVHTSGESKEFECSTPVVLEKGRPWDKAESAALTLDLAYFLRGLLLLPRGEEHTVDQRDDRAFTPPAHQTPAEPPAKALDLAPFNKLIDEAPTPKALSDLWNGALYEAGLQQNPEIVRRYGMRKRTLANGHAKEVAQ